MQVTCAVEMKANNVVEPYKTSALLDLSPKEAAAPLSPSATSRGGQRVAASKVVPKPAAKAMVEGAASHVFGRTIVLFALPHPAASGLAPLAHELWRIQRQCAMGAHSSYEAAALAPILDQRRDGAFNMSLVSSFRERALLPVAPVATYAERIFPLVACPGRVMVTDTAVYLMPVAINAVAGRSVSRQSPPDSRRDLCVPANPAPAATPAPAGSSATSGACCAGDASSARPAWSWCSLMRRRRRQLAVRPWKRPASAAALE